jgi:flagellar motility protein MotE (MotC chaperone)
MRISLLSLIILASLVLFFFKATSILDKVSLQDLSPITAAYAEEAEDETPEETQEEQTAESSLDQRVEYTPTELDILQRLASRREELEEWEKELEIKESILKITQEKIDQKINELRTLKNQVSASLEEYNAKESKKIESLVKIYENMKPKAAAKIFSRLDMGTLLSVTERMKEDKVALILAKMDPVLAKELTINFAQKGKLTPP